MKPFNIGTKLSNNYFFELYFIVVVVEEEIGTFMIVHKLDSDFKSCLQLTLWLKLLLGG